MEVSTPTPAAQLASQVLPERIALTDDQGCIESVNQAWRDLAAASGADARQLCEGANYFAVCAAAARNGCADARVVAMLMREVLAGHRKAAVFEYKITTPQGERQCRAKITPLRCAGRPVLLLAHEDVGAVTRTEDELHLTDMVYRTMGEAIVVSDADPGHAIVGANPAFTRLSGYAEDELLGQATGVLLGGQRGRTGNREALRRLEQTGQFQGKVWNRHKDSREYAEWMRSDTAYDKVGRPSYHVHMFSGITDQRQAEDTIWQQANFDFLTGLPNRKMFYDRLEQEMRKSRRSGQPLALLYIDLDHFKEINDTLGHFTGDVLLKMVAERLSDCVRGVDTIARLGGDEFTVILSELDEINNVERAARAMLKALSEPFLVGEETLYLSASIGITLYPNDATDAGVLCKHADQAMYVAKERGRNQFSFFMPAMQRAAQAKMRMVNDLRSAQARGQFRLAYQPIVELASGAIRKAEALVRWDHPVRGDVSPVEFVPLAEETGLIVGIGEWVIGQAFEQVQRWRAGIDPGFQVSVNMSPAQFRRHAELAPDLLRGLRDGAAAAGNDTGIGIEITEGLLLEPSADIHQQLLVLRERGIEVSIDDFGTGYSSLSYLKKFHIDYLKIDQSFVRKMEADSDDLALCEAIVVMGHKLGIKIIAEGVETAEQRDLLTNAGCDYGQGFLFSAPESAEALAPLLRRGCPR